MSTTYIIRTFGGVFALSTSPFSPPANLLHSTLVTWNGKSSLQSPLGTRLLVSASGKTSLSTASGKSTLVSSDGETTLIG